MGWNDDSAQPEGCSNEPFPIRTSLDGYFLSIYKFFDGPVTWFRKTIVEPNRKVYPWYHIKFRRVPDIDTCYTDDYACFYEADQQYKRDRQVDAGIIAILRQRVEDCIREEYPDWKRCMPMKKTLDEASAAYFCKYGDMGAQHSVLHAYMKQKHRLIWERRHGPVGSGMKKSEYAVDALDDH